jgi:hypothetical protein
VVEHSLAETRLDEAQRLLQIAIRTQEGDWDDFKVLLAATIVMARSTLHLIQKQYEEKGSTALGREGVVGAGE